MGATENRELMQTADDAWNSQASNVGCSPRQRELSMIKRRFSLVVGATAALVIGGTHAFADATSAQASTPDMLNTASQADATGVVGSVVNTVTSALGSGAGSASTRITAGSPQPKAQVNVNVPAPPPVSLPALPELPAVGGVTSTVSKTLNSVTGTVNGLLGSVTSSLPLSVPSISSINNVTGILTPSLPVAPNACLQVVGCL